MYRRARTERYFYFQLEQTAARAVCVIRVCRGVGEGARWGAPFLTLLVETTTGKALALLCLAAFAGLRASEIRGLRWANLDLGSKPTVTVSQRADRWSVLGSPKSDAAKRTVPLGETSAQALRAWKLAQPPVMYREDREKRQKPHVLVFGTATDQPDTLPNLRSRVLAPAMVAAGVSLPVLDDAGKPTKDKDGKPITRPKYTSLHSLRHYAISAWLRTCDGDFKRVQSWARHATLCACRALWLFATQRSAGKTSRTCC